MKLIYKKYVFFRDDDVAELNDKLKMLVDIFIFHKIPIHFSLIPDQLTEECRDFFITKIKIYKDLIEIGQHGFSHKNYSTSGDRLTKYEFGDNRSYAQQKEDITAGKEILQNYFKNKITIFTPPWHGFDKNTLRILDKEGFLAISAGRKNTFLYNYVNLKHIPISIDFNKRNDAGGWFVEKNIEMMRKINRMQYLKMGILLHHNAFNDKNDFDQLDEFLNLLKGSKSLKFISLSKSPLFGIDKNIIKHDFLAYYLNYQFVPKPLTITRGSINPIIRKFNFNYLDNPKILKKSENDICENVYSRLKEVIKRQLPDKGEPVGVLLSGGLDSTALLHTIRDITDGKIYTLTGAYSKNANNLIAAKIIAERYNTIHDSLIITPESIKKIDELYSKNIPQPIGDNGFLAAYLLMSRLKKNVNHIFSGDGADCLFCGLKMHYLNFLEKNCPGKLNLKSLNSFKGETIYEHYKFGEIFLDKEDLQVLFERNDNAFKLEAPLECSINKIKAGDSVKRQILLDLNFLVKNRVDYLVYAAKANNINVRLPYLDKEFINLAIRIPSEYLITGSKQQKYILKKVFDGRLPRAIIHRKKEGFTPPFKYWYSENREFVIKKILKSKKLGISDAYINYLIHAIKYSDSYKIGMKIWLVLNLVSWYEHTG